MSTSVTNVVSHFPSAENGFTTTLASTISSAATTVPLNSVAGYTNGETVVFVVDPADATKKQTFTGIIDTAGVQVTSVVWTAGTNQTHAGGATVVDYVTATHISMVTKGLLVSHDQDGTLKAGAVDVAAVLATDVVETAKIKDLNITTAKIADGAVTSEKQTCTVAFRGTTTQSVTSGVDTIDTYTEVTDLGGDFDHTTGIFTAPYAGIYHFDASMQFADNTARLYIFLVCSTAGTVVGNMGYNGVANGELCAWFGITVALAANETAYVSVNNQSSGGAQSLAAPSYFSGHLVGKV